MGLHAGSWQSQPWLPACCRGREHRSCSVHHAGHLSSIEPESEGWKLSGELLALSPRHGKAKEARIQCQQNSNGNTRTEMGKASAHMQPCPQPSFSDNGPRCQLSWKMPPKPHECGPQSKTSLNAAKLTAKTTIIHNKLTKGKDKSTVPL